MIAPGEHVLVFETSKAKFFSSSMCETLTQHAKDKLGPSYRVLIGQVHGGPKKYILVHGEEAIFENPVAEDVAVKIDMLWLCQRKGWGRG